MRSTSQIQTILAQEIREFKFLLNDEFRRGGILNQQLYEFVGEFQADQHQCVLKQAIALKQHGLTPLISVGNQQEWRLWVAIQGNAAPPAVALITRAAS